MRGGEGRVEEGRGGLYEGFMPEYLLISPLIRP